MKRASRTWLLVRGEVGKVALASLALLFCTAPTPGDVGGCGQRATELDPGAFFASKARLDCKRWEECSLGTFACASVCNFPDSYPAQLSRPMCAARSRRRGVSARAALRELRRLRRLPERPISLGSDRVRLLPGVHAVNRVALLLLLAGAPSVASCVSIARVTGDFGDYRSYRQTRVANTLEERLGASERYLRDYPKGDYHEAVRRWFAPQEKRYLRLSWDNLPRLRAYLDVMPHGPHSVVVTERITEPESRRIFSDRRDQRVLDRAQGFEARLAEAAEQRRAFLRELTQLTKLLASTRSYGEPTSALDPELLLRFQVRRPVGHCDGDLCSKVFSFRFAVPEHKALALRLAEVTLEIILERGLVQQLALSGKELFARVAEAVTVRAVPPNNAQANSEALGQALEVVSGALDGPLPAARCTASAVSPVVLARRCDGVRAEVVTSTEPGEPDRIVVRPEPR